MIDDQHRLSRSPDEGGPARASTQRPRAEVPSAISGVRPAPSAALGPAPGRVTAIAEPWYKHDVRGRRCSSKLEFWGLLQPRLVLQVSLTSTHITMTYDTFPSKVTISLEPFTINTPKAELDDLKALLKLTRVPKSTFENTQTKPHFGVNRDWVIEARRTWTEEFDWQKQVDRINAISQWIATVKNHDGLEYKIHLLGLISQKKDAVPVILSHGWPGSFLEFLPMFELVKQKWSEDDLP